MKRWPCLWALFSLLLISSASARADDRIVALEVDPPAIRLQGPEAAWTLLVSGRKPDGRWVDLTGSATFRSDGSERLTVSSAGMVRGLADGAGSVTVEAAGQRATVSVEVSGSHAPRQFNFENDVVPLLNRF